MATVPGSAHLKKYQKPVNHFKKPPYSPLPETMQPSKTPVPEACQPFQEAPVQPTTSLINDYSDSTAASVGLGKYVLATSRKTVPVLDADNLRPLDSSGSTRISDQMDQDTLPGIPRSDFAWRGYLHCPLLKKISYFIFYQLVSFLGCYSS